MSPAPAVRVWGALAHTCLPSRRMRARRLVTHALPALALLLALAANAQLAALARLLLVLLTRAASLALVLAGSGSVWWALRAWQLRQQQELLDQAWAKLRFLQRYRSSTGGSSSAAEQPPRSAKRLPLPAHLRTAWGLPPEVADELALVAQLAVRDYVGFWYQPLSPANDDFPADLRLLLADLLGALAARVLEIDSSQALAVAANAIEILRLHLGWFREAYAQLGEDFPAVFGDAGGDASDENLLRRQEYVAGFVQKSPFLHPGCAAPASSSSRKPARETPEVVYLRHVASQILVQLKPELGFQYDASVFVSLVMNLMREATTFKILRPMAEYAQQRYANELVLASLQAYLGAKDTAAGPLSPIGHTAVGSLNALSSAATHSISGVGGMTLNKLRSTKSFLYKATKRSSEQAEAAFLAVVDAVHSTGPAAAAAVAAGHADTGFDGDEWSDAPSYALSDAAMSATPPARAKHAAATGAPERKQHFATPFSLNDRLSIPRATRLKAPRAFLPGASGGLKTGGGGGVGVNGIDDLKNIKANIGSSLSKVKRRFRTLSGHPNDPDTPNAGGVGFPSTQAAARMMKKPGMLLQKALRRNDGPAMLSPLSPTNSLDEVLTPPPLSDDDFILGGDLSDPPSPSRADESMAIDELAVDTEVVAVEGDDDDEVEAAVQLEAERVSAAAAVRERAVELLEKATAGYVRMCQERPEMRSSARARELFEFLSAMEDVFLLGYTDGEEVEDMAIGMENSRRQQYWNYLAQDRPETPFLDDHRTFVASKCPACAESESFCSTRGVQWILVALEKGMLWKYMTALHLDQTLTERFYDQDESVFRSGRLMESVLKSLVQLNQISIALEIPGLLGRKDEMDEAFGVSASASKLSSSAAGVDSSSSNNVVCVLESVWEVERYLPIQGWTRTQDKRWQELPSSEWIWEGEWTVAVNSSSDSALALEAAASSGDVWEYAKTFEDRFHEKEKKFDSVRRRKWVRRRRQLPCVLSAPSAPRKAAGPPPTPVQSPVLAAIPSSSSQAPKLPSSPPALFGTASLPVAPASTVITLGAAGKVRNVKQFFDLSKRGKAKTDDTAIASPSLPFSRKPLMKRRSSSFDKSMFASPIADLMLSLESPKNVPLTPEKTAPPEEEKTKKKRRSIPSLRRSNTSSTKDTKVALGLVRSTTTGSTTAGDESTGRRSSLLDSDDDDDDKLCFRCFTPLHGDDESEDAVVAFTTCPSCQQRVCSTCLCHLAFLVFPPPLEVSTKAHVCGPCYDRLAGKYRVKVEAHVSKYFLRERDSSSSSSDGDSSQLAAGDGSDTEASSANGRAAAAPRFEIVVFVKDKAAFAWSVVKTFQDFEALEKQLSEKLKKQEKKHGAGCRGCHWKGVDYTELLGVEPSLKKLPVAALAYDKRLYVLEQFVQSLLTTDTLCQSPPVQKFLGLSNAVSAASGVGSRPFSPTAAAAARSSDVRGEYPGSPSAGVADGAAASSTNSSSSGATGVVMMENGKWRKGRWVAPETSSNETKVRLLQKLEVSLFAVVGEMFEFDGIGVVRRQLFAMSRSFIKAFLSASHFRKLEKQYLSFTDPKKVAAAIVTFREYMFPDPDAPPPPVPPATLSAAEMQALRKDALDAILASFPSTLVSLFGETSCENAALKLHEFVQHEVFVKNLLFSVADEVLQQLFPDFVLFKSKQVVGSSTNSSSVLPPK